MAGIVGDMLKSGAAGYSALTQFGQGEALARQGEARQRASQYEAKQLKAKAGAARATSQRASMDARRKERLIQSTLQARSAGGGGGATDPGVMKIAGDIAA